MRYPHESGDLHIFFVKNSIVHFRQPSRSPRDHHWGSPESNRIQALQHYENNTTRSPHHPKIALTLLCQGILHRCQITEKRWSLNSVSQGMSRFTGYTGYRLFKSLKIPEGNLTALKCARSSVILMKALDLHMAHMLTIKHFDQTSGQRLPLRCKS